MTQWWIVEIRFALLFCSPNSYEQYETLVGVDGQLITGKPPSASTDIFRSQAELVAAMGDPRYDNDPAYRQDVVSKLDRSKINF